MNEKPGSRPGFLRNVWGVGQSRHLAMCRSLPIYPQLRKWHCTAITDATCHKRKCAVVYISEPAHLLIFGSC